MYDFGWGEAIEPRRGRVAVGADLLGVHQVVDFQIRELLGLHDRIHAVAGLAEDGTHLAITGLDRLDAVLAVIEDDAGEGVVNAVVDVVARLAVAVRLADDARDGGGSGGDEEAAGFG